MYNSMSDFIIWTLAHNVFFWTPYTIPKLFWIAAVPKKNPVIFDETRSDYFW